MKLNNIKIPTPVIDLTIVVTPYLLGFIETQLTGQSMIFNALDKLSFGEKFILFILTFLLVEIIDYKYSYNGFVDRTQSDMDKINIEIQNAKSRLDGLQNKIALINQGQSLDAKLSDIKHPYFVSLISTRIKTMLTSNKNLFEQTEYTSPCHANTFGAHGIRSTTDELKCVSFIPEYWEDKNDTEYMNTQINLLKRGVRIKRLFIINDNNRDNTLSQMKYQNNLGIETRCIEQSMVEAGFKEKDYLLQDNQLLVELYFDDDTDDKRHREAKELITTEELLVIERKEQFLTNWASAKAA